MTEAVGGAPLEQLIIIIEQGNKLNLGSCPALGADRILHSCFLAVLGRGLSYRGRPRRKLPWLGLLGVKVRAGQIESVVQAITVSYASIIEFS